jgi:WD40 repeat protein/class 3 adenylate cyclase
VSGLPSGAVTFLFTDIEGSTRLVKALRERYPLVLAEHRRLVRAAIAGQAGYEVGIQGDAFFAAFAGAKQAVLCALEIQRALAAHQWPDSAPVRVRIGIHTGHAVPAEGDYTGLAVHRAARICAAAVGGQVLVSQATQMIIADEEEEEPGFTLVDLGERELKDLDRPVRLFELAAPGLETRPSPAAARMRGCPYRGLLPFGESDAAVFYGRERLAAELAAKLAARAAGGGLVVVTGASGSGKSSLLRAGLLPILARGRQVPGSNRWPRVVMTPTKDPLTELAARLAAVGGPDALAVRDGLAGHPDQAHLAIRSAVLAAAARGAEEPPGSGDGAARLVLVIDQFEQVFTLSPDLGGEATGQAFITALCSATATPVGAGQEPPALVVIAVRGDFWDRCAAVPDLVDALQDGQFVVGPMTESELRVAITGPAEAARLRIDPGLTDTILEDLRVAGGDRSAGVLPLLSQAMALTWEHREGDRLTSHGYAQAGGVSHAVQTGADRAYEALPAGQQELAREVLRSMTVATRDGGLARRPVTRDDLYTGLPGADRSDIDAVLDAFAAERMAVLDEDRAQLSHDVLLRAWPRLRGWLEEDQAGWILYGQLADAAATWHDSGEDPSFLYRGAQLAALRQTVTQWSANPARSPALTGTQPGFLQASERAAARSIRRRQGGFAVLALLTALAVAAAGFAFSQRAAAIRQRDQAIYNQVIAEALQHGTSDITLAAQLNLAAWRIQPTQDLASRLLNTENTPLASPLAIKAGSASTVTFSQKGHILASGSADGTIRLWDVSDPAHPRLLGQPLTVSGVGIRSVAFSPDAHTLVGVDYGGTVQLWDVADPAHPRPLGQPLAGGGISVVSLAFSPDGRTLASSGSPANGNGAVQLWDVADPAHPRLLGQPQAGNEFVDSLAFSPDGHTLASGSGPASGSVGGTVQLWDVADPAHPRPLGQPLTAGGASTYVISVAFSPDGHALASTDAPGTVLLWDVTDPAHPRPLGQPLTAGGASAVDSVAFSPDGHTLTSASADGTIRLWDVADLAHPRPLGQPLTAGNAPVLLVAFGPDGHTLASASADGTIRLWSLPQTVLTGGSAPVITAAFSPDGHTLASASADGTIRLWDVADPAHPHPLGQTFGSAPLYLLAFSPRGHMLASVDALGAARLWDVADPAHPRPLGQPQTAGDESVDSLAFSPSGHTLAIASSPASGSGSGTVQLWDVADPAHPRPLGQPQAGSEFVDSLAFSPDGRTLAGGGSPASGSGGGTVQLWDVADPAHPRPLGQPQAGGGISVVSLAFSPSGHTLAIASGPASGSGGGTVQLWDVADPAHPRPLGQPQTAGGASTYVISVAFSPDGHTLASIDALGTVLLWDVTDPAHPRSLGQPPTGGASAVDSAAFSPDGHTLATGSFDGTIRLWNLNVQYAIERICATAGGLTSRQWNQYIPQLHYQPSCIH